MHDEMGTFRVDIEIENPARPGERRIVKSALVDSGAELSWIPSTILESLAIRPYKTWRFRQADGTILERSIGLAFLHVAGKSTGDDVVFGEPGDLVLLGSRTLEGLNFRIEPLIKQLVDAGPAPAALALCVNGSRVPSGQTVVRVQVRRRLVLRFPLLPARIKRLAPLEHLPCQLVDSFRRMTVAVQIFTGNRNHVLQPSVDLG